MLEWIFQITVAPDRAADPRGAFHGALGDSLEETLAFDVAQTFHENITAQLADRKKDAAPLQVSRKEIASPLDPCHVPAKEQDLNSFPDAKKWMPTLYQYWHPMAYPAGFEPTVFRVGV